MKLKSPEKQNFPFDQRSWVKIDQQALKKNFQNLSKSLSSNRIKKMAIVKSNAYGHGMLECAKIFSQAGADFLGVDCLEEAQQLREADLKTPVLVLGWTSSETFSFASKNNISVTISSLNSLKQARKITEKNSSKLKIHLKIDTGLHRQGLLIEEIDTAIKILIQAPKIELEGLYSHLSSAENPRDILYTQKQTVNFIKVRELFWQNGYKPICHLSASAASLLYPEINYDMVRFGITLYGLWPSKETEKTSRENKKNLKLWPALTWQTRISEIKKIAKGESVGYDHSEKVKRDSLIGVIPVGYWHGYPRQASSKSFVLINGKLAKVLGKISMDMMVIDLTDIKKVRPGDLVTLIGSDHKQKVSAEKLAQTTDTINYEIVTRINPLTTRIYF